MALTQAFEAVAGKPIAGREAAKEAMDEMLRQAVSLFALRRADAISTIRNLQAKDQANFVPAAAPGYQSRYRNAAGRRVRGRFD